MRPRKPWYRSDRDAWFIVLNGKQTLLAKGKDNRQEAEQAYHRLMLETGEQPVKPANLTLPTLCDLFLDHSQRSNSPKTYAWYRSFLQSFCDRYPKLSAADLKPFHVTTWTASHKRWKGAVRCAIICVKRAVSWATEQGLLVFNPLKALKKPSVRRRERVLSDDEYAKLFAAIPDDAFKDFVSALRETGCRPSEVARVAAENVNLDMGAWILQEHKTRHATHRPRVVYLTPAMIDMTRRLMHLRPEGPLFRNRYGRPYTPNAIRCRFRELRKRVPELKGVVSYSVRHSFATHALLRGVGVAQVAELLGNSVAMVDQHYGHLAQQTAHMQAAARKAVGG